MSKTILMIHGFGASGEGWAPAAASFRAAGYAVETPTIAADLRTPGTPPPGLAGKTLADYVAEMKEWAKTLAARDGEKPVVFGHSMGGLIAQKLAEAGLTSGIVLFAPASPADARGKPQLSPVFTFLNIALTGKPETKAVKIWKTGFKWGVLNQTPAARHDALFATTVHDSGRALSDLAYPDRDPNKTVSVDTGKVTVPVLVLAGARDRTTPVEDLRLVGRKYPGADYKEYANHAHWLIDEPGSDTLLAEVKAWLEAKGLGPSKAAPKVVDAKPQPAPAPEPVKAAEPAPAVAAPKTAKAPAKPKTAPKAPAKTAEKSAKAPAKPAPAAKAAQKPAPAKTTAKAPAAKPVAPAPKTTKAVAAKPAPAKAETKPAAAPKIAKAATPKTPPKATPKVTPSAAAASKAAAPKAAAKPAKAAAKPATTRTAKAPAAKPAPAPKAAPAKAVAPAPKAAKTPAKPKAAPKATPAKAPAKPAAAKPVAAAKAATPKAASSKPAATKAPAKSSPRTKKSV
ncbi:MAG: alpha/beta hydrolase [Caulobacter sp.]|nr:alpha/beta hydrolase [Caulobacter sp.]